MEINFNEGKKELDNTSEIDSHEEMISEDGEIITDYEEDTTDYNRVRQSINKDEFKEQIKKILIIAAVIIGIFFLFIVLAILFVKKSYTYDDIEATMKKAAQEYFKDYSDYLPKEENDSKIVPVANLVEGNYMKELSSYLPEGVTCDGKVTVEKLSSSYDYQPYLNCGDKYETIELYKRVTKEENIVTSDYGLYSLYGNYVFRGETVNNYVQLGDNLWRIFKVTSDGNIGLVYSKRISLTSLSWDDRYNKSRGYNIGMNNYATSRVKENLQKLYNNEIDENFKLLSKADKAKLAKFDLCVGKRAHKDTTNNNSIECSEKATDVEIGLLTISDYMQASLDSNCKKTLSQNCHNYNYLNTPELSWWFATADKSNSYDVYYYNPDYGIQIKHASNQAYLRPVVYLKSNVFYKSGNGTEKTPYKIK